MIGPLVLAVVAVAAGAISGGAAGALVGLFMAAVLSATVIVAAAVWVDRIGQYLEVEDARASAPCPPGFGRLCALAYRRLK